MTTKHKSFPKNTVGRDFIIGDLHGNLALFNKMLEGVSFDKTVDRMFSVGDLIDRGDSSYECALLLKEDWFHSVKGNHELMLLSATTEYCELTADAHHWVTRNGGSWVIEYEGSSRLYEIRNMINKLPVLIDIETDNGLIGVVHANSNAETWDELINKLANHYHIEDMLWGRRIAKDAVLGVAHSDIQGVRMVVHGHTPMKQYTVIGNRAFIDTGAYDPRGSLTVMQLQPEIVYSTFRM